jgi:hypothetical protein
MKCYVNILSPISRFRRTGLRQTSWLSAWDSLWRSPFSQIILCVLEGFWTVQENFMVTSAGHSGKFFGQLLYLGCILLTLFPSFPVTQIFLASEYGLILVHLLCDPWGTLQCTVMYAFTASVSTFSYRVQGLLGVPVTCITSSGLHVLLGKATNALDILMSYCACLSMVKWWQVTIKMVTLHVLQNVQCSSHASWVWGYWILKAGIITLLPTVQGWWAQEIWSGSTLIIHR